MYKALISMDNGDTIELKDITDPNDFMNVFENTLRERRIFELTKEEKQEKIFVLPQKVSHIKIY